MKNRKYYEQLYTEYPTVVTLIQFRQMLGGIGDTYGPKVDARKPCKTLLHPSHLPYSKGLGD